MIQPLPHACHLHLPVINVYHIDAIWYIIKCIYYNKLFKLFHCTPARPVAQPQSRQ